MKRIVLKTLKWTGIVIVSLFLLITALLYFFKDEICGIVINEINKNLKAKVEVKHVDLAFWSSFPNLSVDFENVFIQDSYAYATNKDTLFYSDRVRLKFNPIDIWNEKYHLKHINVEPGCIKIKVNKKGEPNYDIFKPSDTTSTSNFEMKLKQVNLEKIKFTYNNKVSKQYFHTKIHALDLQGDFTETKFELATKSDLKIVKIKSGEVTLLANKAANLDVKIQVDYSKNEVRINNALVHISNLPFKINGYVNKEQNEFNIQSANIELKDLMNQFSLKQTDDVKRFDGKGLIYFDLNIKGENKIDAKQLIDCSFKIENGQLREPNNGLTLNQIYVDGKYSNHGKNIEEYLSLKSLKCASNTGLFEGNLMITEFDSPHVVGTAKGDINLTLLHAILHLPQIENIKGNIGISSDFDIKTLMNENDFEIRRLTGEADLQNVEFKLLEDRRVFEKINGHIYLRNEEAGIENLSLLLNQSDFLINGVFQNIVAFVRDKGKVNVNAQLQSRNIRIEDLGTTTKEEKVSEKTRSFVLPDFLEANVGLDIQKITYEHHIFKELKGNMNYKDRRFDFPAINISNANAQIQGSLSIDEQKEEIFYITTNLQTSSMEFKSLFKEWDNFHQDVINANNVYGNAKAKIYFEAPFDLRNGVVSNSIKSDIYLIITNGKLKDVQQFKSITESIRTSQAAKTAIGPKNIVGLEKKLLNLEFATLENTFKIRNGVLEIPQMKIASNALDIDVSGTHSFNNNINYRFEFRFRDLKEKQQVSEFGEEVDDESGFRVYMKMYGTIDQPKIEWDQEAKKEDRKANIEQEKQDVKSMLKSEFGLFKGDSTVKNYQEKQKVKETFEFDFGNEPKKQEETSTQKESKLKEKLKKLKENSEKEQNQKIDIEFE